MTDSRSDSITFASLGLKPEVMQGIREAGFVTCTPIQAQTLPIALAGRDVAGQAQTGTGKTAAFLVALYQALLTRPAPPGRSPTSVRARASPTWSCSAASTTRSSVSSSRGAATC